MTKISLDELDAMVFPKEALEAPISAPDEKKQEVNPQQTGENSTKEPALRKSIDALSSGVMGAAGAGAAVITGLSKMRSNMPLNEID